MFFTVAIFDRAVEIRSNFMDKLDCADRRRQPAKSSFYVETGCARILRFRLGSDRARGKAALAGRRA